MKQKHHLDFIKKIYLKNINDLIFLAQKKHRKYHSSKHIQKSTLLSIKTGGCKEDCKYCAQSKYYNTSIKPSKLMDLKKVLHQAKLAKENGSSRFCMGSSGTKILNDHNFETILKMIKEVKKLNLETCVTLGMLDDSQAKKLKQAGLDYYNHNLDTSPEYYEKIVTTRTYPDRLATLESVKKAGIHVCTGGILGMGESQKDRISFLRQLVIQKPHPKSITINQLVPIKGTPLENIDPIDPIEMIRTIATARILMPKSTLRLSAGRENMSVALQTLSFLAGANSIFSGEKLLTTSNFTSQKDQKLFKNLRS